MFYGWSQALDTVSIFISQCQWEENSINGYIYIYIKRESFQCKKLAKCK